MYKFTTLKNPTNPDSFAMKTHFPHYPWYAEPKTDLFLVYEVLLRLSTPFSQWPAFKQGIIDTDGKVLRKRETFTSKDDERAWTMFDILMANIKKALNQFPSISSKFQSFLTSTFLLKEFDETASVEAIAKRIVQLVEETTNVVGGGAIAGAGVGAQGEPPGPSGVMTKKKKMMKPLRRKVPDVPTEF